MARVLIEAADQIPCADLMSADRQVHGVVEDARRDVNIESRLRLDDWHRHSARIDSRESRRGRTRRRCPGSARTLQHSGVALRPLGSPPTRPNGTETPASYVTRR